MSDLYKSYDGHRPLNIGVAVSADSLAAQSVSGSLGAVPRPAGPAPAPALEMTLSHLQQHNAMLRQTIDNLEQFLARAGGPGAIPPQQTGESASKPADAGSLGSIEAELRHGVSISIRLATLVGALNRIA